MTKLHGADDHRDGPVVPQPLSETMGNGLSTKMAWKKDAPNGLKPALKHAESYCCIE